MAVLLNEGADTITVASRSGFRCFTNTADFKNYVGQEILGERGIVDRLGQPSGVEDAGLEISPLRDLPLPADLP